MLLPRIMKLHRYIDHDSQMTPIDVQVIRISDRYYSDAQVTQVDSSQPKTTQVDASQPKSTQVNPSRPKSTQVNPSQPESTQVDPSRPKSTQVIKAIQVAQGIRNRLV
ncbi:hypothetical protein DPMN_016862 [Dreissena polymorpha]|uniref:Uncharacterized protein n=1 Tax=Dreissena polymorpha TaxID=45954 RepID=A0A9D4NE52_DREPO|nr:hypothetical protein DPMN_016862 [Dreissena polymorpha]